MQNLGSFTINEIHCGDSAVLLKQLPAECIDLTVTSPPYDNLRSYNQFVFDFEAIANELFRVTKSGGVLVWVIGDATVNGSETLTSFRQAIRFQEIGFNVHDTMIYRKHAAFAYDPRQKRYKQVFEYMFVFSKGSPKTYNPIADKAGSGINKIGSSSRKKDGTIRKHPPVQVKKLQDRDNIWVYNVGNNMSTKDKIAFEHPAIFPEALANDHIYSWSNKGDVVLDIFAGSGTTLKMAKMLNRNYIGFEISQEYCDLAQKRVLASPVPLLNWQSAQQSVQRTGGESGQQSLFSAGDTLPAKVTRQSTRR